MDFFEEQERLKALAAIAEAINRVAKAQEVANELNQKKWERDTWLPDPFEN